jgi:uncharacterized protein (UPF0212 family)
MKFKLTVSATRITEYEKIIEAKSLEEAEKIADHMTTEDMEEVDQTTMDITEGIQEL